MYLVDHAAPARHRRDPRLGAVALPHRRARPRLLRRHAPLRARRPAPGLPPRLEELHLQLRPQRGAQLPALAARSSGSTRYHVDGLRVDAVASMLYLDYSRKAGEWIPNEYGGTREPRGDRVPAPLQRRGLHARIPDVQTIAEESTAWPMVSRPTYVGGLGFGFKWDMGWMHDTLAVHARDPIHRTLPPRRADLPHALRLHRELRAAALARRGRARQGLAARQDAGRRLAAASPTCACSSATCTRSPARSCCSWAASSASGRSGTTTPSLDWHLLDYPAPRRRCSAGCATSTALYRAEPALHELDCDPARLRVDRLQRRRAQRRQLSCARARAPDEPVVVGVFNFTPVPRHNYRVGVPRGGFWREVLNSDAAGLRRQRPRQPGRRRGLAVAVHGRPHRLR